MTCRMKMSGIPMRKWGLRILCLKRNMEASMKGEPPRMAKRKSLFSGTRRKPNCAFLLSQYIMNIAKTLIIIR